MLTEKSRTALTWGSATGAFLLALTFFGWPPGGELTNAGAMVVLFVTSSILIFESFFEESEKRRVPIMQIFREMKFQNLIFLILAAIGYILGILILLAVPIPALLAGIAGFIVMLQAIGILYEKYR